MGYYLTSTPETITVTVTPVSGRLYYRIFIRLSSSSTTLATVNRSDKTTEFSVTFSGCTPGTSYTCNVIHWETSPTVDGSDYIEMGAQSITTKTYPSFSLSATSDTVTFTVVPGSGYTQYRLILIDADNGDTTVFNEEFLNITSTFSYIVTELNHSTTYAAYVMYGANTSMEDFLGPKTITTEAAQRPSDWAWTTAIATAYTVPKYGELLAPVTAAEWNDFCARINQFRSYKNMTAYSFTAVSSGTGIASAILKQAIAAISAISGHGTLPTVYDVLKASFWQQLASALNSIT